MDYCLCYIDNLNDINYIFKRQLKQSSKLKKRSKGKRESVEEMIKLRKWPANGISDLQGAVLKNMSWIENIVSENHFVDKQLYNKILGMTVAAIYAFCPNGRIQALAELKESQFSEFDNTPGHIMSSAFKTMAKFGVQPVIFDHAVVLRLMGLYKVRFRPKTPNGPEAPFFITYKGSPYKIGRGVTVFFQRELGIQINITKIRSIVETEMHKLQLRGVITAEERASVMNINGHSSQVTKDYYVREERLEDVRNGCAAFRKLAGSVQLHTPENVEEDISSTAVGPAIHKDVIDYDFIECDTYTSSNFESHSSNRKILFEEDSNSGRVLSFEEEFGLNQDFFLPAIVEFGGKHPNQNKDALRVTWSDAEVKIIGKWCDDNLSVHPNWKSTIVARCLNFINGSDEARPYFHPHHVTDSSRLRSGYEHYLKTNK